MTNLFEDALAGYEVDRSVVDVVGRADVTLIEPETTSYPPSALFAAQANAGRELSDRANDDRLEFWAEQARELLWDSDFSEVLDWSNAPFARWFVGGTVNVSVNCVDRHVDAGKGDRVAIHWVGEPGDARDITYGDLLSEVAKVANYLTELGLAAGDRVVLVMPTVPEAVFAMLACARIGVLHVFLSTDLSATALGSRIRDVGAKVVITSDGHYVRGKSVPLKCAVDHALAAGGCETVETVVVVRRTEHDVAGSWVDRRDVWWYDTVETAPDRHAAPSFDAEHPLFVLYAGCAAGRPEGILHSSGGYLAQARYTFHYVFDHKEGEDVFWCGADLGSIAGHTYQVYGPLSAGATTVLYEGAAGFPSEHRHFQIIEDYGVTVYYVAPSVIRRFMSWGRDVPDAHDLSSLRLLATMTEHGDPAASRWYREVIGRDRCPVVDTWWQPETGAIVIAPLPGLNSAKPGSPVEPLPGISAHIVDRQTDLVAPGERGSLVLDRPWPAMPRGIWCDDERFVEAYWSRFAGRSWYFTGDDAFYDEDDGIWVLGNGDDVMAATGR
ncbi:acetyl-coenzyme A synthetase (plasmid) [Mycolicibacterium arabiense]|uniref:Acetyl-coenzyme A synthetase n=1 Tax=Mycolicibacterium arabiense TaxID=1286181 RepID=A0A7I7RQG2_9MYCO|nr:acetyl-coenzyme A synthetase [Mycolicibacterium arabiense]